MELKITINLDNDDFVERGGQAVVDLLQHVSLVLAARTHPALACVNGSLSDANGNRCGTYRVRG